MLESSVYDRDIACSQRGHKRARTFFLMLERKAWSEIHAKVFMTFGTLFPTEITELIFSAALESEEVPAESRLMGCSS
jgi:hypothetical protein